MSDKRALALFAHPDDAEFTCAGTLALLHRKGWEIHIATMTPGDCGTAEHRREDISRIRKNEATASARLLNGEYHCLEFGDIYILYDRDSITKTVELVRHIRPTIVFTHSPSDYMIDHEVTSQLSQTACFAAGIKNIETPRVDPFEPTPHLYYTDAMEGKDKFGCPITPGLWVDISSVIETKEKMLACHASQRNWLLTHHGMDEYILSMKRFAEQRGRDIDVKYAEGFRQHLGHGYPQDNALKNELFDYAKYSQA